MGGRGSSGGGKGGGGGGGFKTPSFSGTEKQVAWAKDIVKQPYDNAISVAKQYEERSSSKDSTLYRDAQAYRAAAAQYSDAINAQTAGKTISASYVIDNRSLYQSVMDNLIRQERRKRGTY